MVAVEGLAPPRTNGSKPIASSNFALVHTAVINYYNIV